MNLNAYILLVTKLKHHLPCLQYSILTSVFFFYENPLPEKIVMLTNISNGTLLFCKIVFYIITFPCNELNEEMLKITIKENILFLSSQFKSIMQCF